MALQSVRAFFRRIADIPYSPYIVVVVPIVIGTVRASAETLLGYSAMQTPQAVYYVVISYHLLLLALASVLALCLGRHLRDLVGAAAVGLVIAILPPLLQFFFFAEEGKSFRYFTSFCWNFIAPYQSTWETVTAWVAILSSGLFVAILSKSILRTLFALAATYCVMQGYLWGWVAASLSLAPYLQRVRPQAVVDIVGILLVLGIYLAWNWRSLGPSLARVNHSLPWGAVAMLGARMSGLGWVEAGLRGLMMLLAFQLVVFANDYFDFDDDAAVGGKARPASGDDVVIIHYLMGLMVLWTLIWQPSSFLFMLLFFALWAAYQLPGLRMKRFFCLAYKIEGFAGAACFLFGAQVGRAFPPGAWVGTFALLTLGGFSLGSMGKDYKDIEQDRIAKVGTIYTRYMKRGFSRTTIHRVVAFASLVMLWVPPLWMLLTAQSMWTAGLLVLLSAPPAACLYFISDRKRATESYLWALSIYLIAFACAAPQMTGQGAHIF